VLERLDPRKQLPVLHVSGRFAAERGAAALVLPLTAHPTNRNSIIVCNLGVDPGPLLELDAATIRRLLYARSAELPPGMERIPLKEVHANRSPMLAPESMLTAEVAARCGIDHAACRANRERLLAARDLPERLAAVYAPAAAPPEPRDPEADLYGGSFLGDADRRLADRVRAADAATLARSTFAFADPRLPELLFRYRARNFPASLSADERTRWREHCTARLHGEPVGGLLNCSAYRRAIVEARAAHAGDAAKQALLDRLEAYGDELCSRSAPSPASGRGEEDSAVSAHLTSARGRGEQDSAGGAHPSPACGRGEGGEGGGS
jgi:exodeoxyribonuclease-1